MNLRLNNAENATLLNNLVVGSFIELVRGTPGDYRFSIPQLVRFCLEVGIDHLIASADAQAQNQPLTFEPSESEGIDVSRA